MVVVGKRGQCVQKDTVLFGRQTNAELHDIVDVSVGS
jgi:hypothetical protein